MFPTIGRSLLVVKTIRIFLAGCVRSELVALWDHISSVWPFQSAKLYQFSY